MQGRARQAEPIFAWDQDRPAIRILERVLEPEEQTVRLVVANGEEIAFPESVYQAFRTLVQVMASGQAVYLVPHHRELTTQEAAELLNVSRPFVSQLLDRAEMPYVKVGSHRRIRVSDVLDYQKRQQVRTHAALAELTQIVQEEGFYGDVG